MTTPRDEDGTPLRAAEVADEVERRELWAIRWPDGTTSGAMYSDDGSDYAEQVLRAAAGDGDVVHRTETITRTPWVLAALAHTPAEPEDGR